MGRERTLCRLCTPPKEIKVGQRSQHLIDNHWPYLLENHGDWIKRWIIRAMDKHDDLHMFPLISRYLDKDPPQQN